MAEEIKYCPLSERAAIKCSPGCAWYEHGKCAMLTSAQQVVEVLHNIVAQLRYIK